MATATIAQYQGRKVDLLAFQGADPSREVELTQALIREGGHGALISGVQKLAQRFLLELLTEVGSMQHLPERGSLFMQHARAGLWRTAGDVESSFYGSLLRIKRNLRAEESLDDPLDERYDSAELQAVSVSGDSASIRFRVLSLAGDEFEYLHPLRVINFGA